MSTSGVAKLIVHLRDGTSQEYELASGVMHIGRDPSCEIVIRSPFVSHHHALIAAEDGLFTIQDDDSKNGVLVNGKAVREPQPLTDGDRIQLGNVRLTFEAPVETAVFDLASVTLVNTSPLDSRQMPVPEGLQRRGSRPAGTWSILYTDLVGHTQQVAAMGDVAGQRWLRGHNTLLRRQFEQCQGLEDKGLGDGFLVTFASARRAVQCAVAIQRDLRDYNQAHSEPPYQVRMGLHTGEVLKEGDELFGSAVILAARIMSKAGAGEIFISDMMRRLIQGTGEFPIIDRGSAVLKGFPRRQHLYEIRWQDS